MKRLLLALALLFSSSVFAAPPSCHAPAGNLNIFVWADYVPNIVIEQFKCETGISVNLQEYDSNETLYAKLKALSGSGSSSDYDVIIPSSYYVSQMRQQCLQNEKICLLQKLDKTKLPNLEKYINPDLLKKSFDPNNDYSFPYLWGITGIAYNKTYWNQDPPKSWADFWSPRFKDKLLMLDEPKDVFTMALITLGYSPNDKNPEHIKQAYEKLKVLMPNIRAFNSDAVISMYADDDMTVGMGWIGDVYLAQHNNPEVQFVYPSDGYVIWIDSIAIVKNAPHLENAYQFVNFLYEPKIAEEISQSRGYASPEKAATELLPPAIKDNPLVDPPTDVLSAAKNGGTPVYFQDYLGEATNKLYQHYWTLLKLGAGS